MYGVLIFASKNTSISTLLNLLLFFTFSRFFDNQIVRMDMDMNGAIDSKNDAYLIKRERSNKGKL